MKIEELIIPNEVKRDITIYEKTIGFSFPEKFKFFCESYDIGSYFKLEEFYHPVYERKYFIEKVVFEHLDDVPITLLKFDSLEDIFFNWEFKKNEDDWDLHKFLRISSIDIGGGIYIGFDGVYRDMVILIIWDSKDKVIVLANDIYEFIEQSNKIKDLALLYGYDYNQLFKNDGEDFWRVKEENL